MKTSRRFLSLVTAFALSAVAADAQTPSTSQSASTPSDASTRPATTTFYGDTGLWFVPTAEVLAHGKWSGSAYRRGTNYIQGYTNISDFAGTVAVGIKGRAEIFGSFLFDTRIDRDHERPIFLNDPAVGGFVDRYPLVNRDWTGNYVGVKVNLWSEYRQQPAALAVRGVVKLPTADKAVGNGTGKADFFIDFIGSKDLQKVVEWAGYAGYEVRGQPDGFTTARGALRWGPGVRF